MVLVDLSPEALRDRLRAGKVYKPDRAEVALQNFFRLDNLGALRELALRELAEDVEARRRPAFLDPLSQQAVAERVLALVEPQPKSQRIIRRAWRSAQRLGAEIDALWVRKPGRQPTPEEATQLAALRRLASILGVHFLEEEGDDLVATVRRVAHERGSTYIFVGTPDERRRVEILRGSLLSRMVRELPGDRHPSRHRPGASRRAGGNDRCPPSADEVGRDRTANGCSFPSRAARLDPSVLEVAIRIARAENATLVPAYLIVSRSGSRGHADAPAGGDRDAAARGGRARRAQGRRPGRRPRRERPDADPRTEAALGRRAFRPDRRARATGGEPGFTPKDLLWILTNAPSETVILRPRAESDAPSVEAAVAS